MIDIDRDIYDAILDALRGAPAALNEYSVRRHGGGPDGELNGEVGYEVTLWYWRPECVARDFYMHVFWQGQGCEPVVEIMAKMFRRIEEKGSVPVNRRRVEES